MAAAALVPYVTRLWAIIIEYTEYNVQEHGLPQERISTTCVLPALEKLYTVQIFHSIFSIQNNFIATRNNVFYIP